MPASFAEIAAVAANFQFRGTLLEAAPYGSGHINDTYRIIIGQGGCRVPYILQRLNSRIFADVPALMENITRVTEHIRSKLAAQADADWSRKVLQLVPTTDNRQFLQTPDGDFWRAYIFIDGARTFDFVDSPAQAREAGRAFGEFQKQLSDLPGQPLHEILPDFHNTPVRMQNFLRALERDSQGRAVLARPEIEFALAHQPMNSRVEEGLANGSLPHRVTHNDTKINNVLLNAEDGRGLCVIDLDTVMPGSVLYDFGDQIRTSTSTSAEDEEDLAKVRFRMDLFAELLHGYLASAADFLTPNEMSLLPFSGQLITFEIGLRFLTDFLEGDVYFKTSKLNHNLFRCRTQFELVRQMEEKAEEMQRLLP